MILDNTIDYNTAKFWCVFADIAHIQDRSMLKINEDLGALAIFGGIMTAISVISMLTPFAKNMYNNIISHRNSVIAITEFEADGKKYRAFFDMKKRAWKLVSTFTVSSNESISFFSTNFFKRFNLRCLLIITPILDNKNELINNSNRIKDEKLLKVTKIILDNEQIIKNYMFNAKIST